MSWSFSPALVAAFSEACCLDTEPSVQSRTTPMPDQFYWPDKPTEHSRISRFGMTCAPLMGDRGEALLTWFREGSRARMSVPLVEEMASTANVADSGRKWLGSFAKYDPDSCAWRTPQCSLLEDSEEYSETWPRWGSMRNGECCLRPTPALPICANESGWSRIWPTPVASMHKSSSLRALTRKDGRSRVNDRLDHAVFAEHRGRLNPEWTELLMGWPIGLTDLRPLGMGKFLEWLRQHGTYLQKAMSDGQPAGTNTNVESAT